MLPHISHGAPHGTGAIALTTGIRGDPTTGITTTVIIITGIMIITGITAGVTITAIHTGMIFIITAEEHTLLM